MSKYGDPKKCGFPLGFRLNETGKGIRKKHKDLLIPDSPSLLLEQLEVQVRQSVQHVAFDPVGRCSITVRVEGQPVPERCKGSSRGMDSAPVGMDETGQSG